MKSIVNLFLYNNPLLDSLIVFLLISSSIGAVIFYVKKADEVKHLKNVALAIFCLLFLMFTANAFTLILYIILAQFYPMIGLVQFVFIIFTLVAITKLTESMLAADNINV